jgi:hypothetical protein
MINSRLQKDYENGIAVEDYHRLNSAVPYKNRTSEFQGLDDDGVSTGNGDTSPQMNYKNLGGIVDTTEKLNLQSEEFISGFGDHNEKISLSPTIPKATFEDQRASFKKPNIQAPETRELNQFDPQNDVKMIYSVK